MLAITNGRIITMTGQNHDQGTILIDGSKIKEIGDNLKIPKGAEIIDATGLVVMPGLIDAHCHVGILEEVYQIEGDDVNEASEPVTPHLRAIDAINPADIGFMDALKGGVTTVFTGPGSANVIGGEAVVMKTSGRVVDEMVIRQPAGLKVAFGENPKRVHGQKNKMPSTRMGTAALLRETMVNAQNYLRKIEAGQKDPAKAPERDLKLEVIGKVLNKEMPMRAHAHRADDMMTAIRIAEEFNVDLVIEHCTEGHKIADILAAKNIPAIVGPSLTNRSKVELMDRTFATAAVLVKAGVKVALMTDHPVIPINFLSLSAALAVKEGLSEEEALRAVTINPAEILGLDKRIGSLAKGKDADIIMLDGTLFDIKTNVVKVLINGQIVYNINK